MRWPDWKDSGRRVKAYTKDFREVEGTLLVDDFFFDGEEDIPCWVIESEGKSYYLSDFIWWRGV